MIISYSEVFKWDTCQRQYFYRFVKQLRPLEESEPMTTGTKGHKLLQNFYTFLGEGVSLEKAHQLTTQSAMALLNKDKFDKPLLVAWTLVDNYIREIKSVPDAVIVEQRFLFPVAEFTDLELLKDVQIGFTPDVVFRRTGDFYDVEDAKFVGRAWSESKVNHFLQAKLYQIMLRKMGYNVSRSMIRFFNTQTGKVKAVPAELRSGEEKTIINDFVSAVKEVVTYRNQSLEEKELSRRTMNYTACQFCAFDYPCMLEARGQSAEQVFATQFVKSDYDYTN